MIIRDDVTEGNNPVICTYNFANVDNISATNQDDNFPASNLANPSTHLRWQMDGDHSDEYLNVDLDGATTVNYLAIASHNFADEGVSCSIEVDTGSGFNEIIAPTAILDNLPLIFQFANQDNTVAIRLRMQGTDIFCRAAVLYTGQILDFERSLRIDQNFTPVRFGTVSDVTSGMSESGQFMGRMVKKQYKESVMSFWYFTDDFYRNQLDYFSQFSVDNPFFVAWCPDPYLYDTGYCWLSKDPKPEMHLPTQRWIMSFEMRGLA